MSDGTQTAILPGEACWTRARANRLGVIVDGADFFRAAKHAMLNARRSIYLIGWDFDARVKLEPEGRTLEGPDRIGKFLNWLAKHREGLDVRILKWDIGLMESLARGETGALILNWLLHDRVNITLDGAHPPGAAHHMKILVVDDAIAFCGGIDITMGRWDTRTHDERRPGRRSPSGRGLKPWHDATTCFDGTAARALGDLARIRWLAATGDRLQPPGPAEPVWPEGVEVHFRDIDIGIARTIPEYRDQHQVCEIENATLAIIRAAQRNLYIESQYLASRKITDAICARLREPDGPDVVIVNPEISEGWLRAKAMDGARARMVALLREADLHGRFFMSYPVNAAGSPIYVHAKIMIADDRILKIGSSNLNNRSMGYDTECDIVIEAGEDEPARRRTIAAIRDGLVGEHLSRPAEEVAAALQAHDDRLLAAISSLHGGERDLRTLPDRPLSPDEEALAESEMADPIRPVGVREMLTSVLRGT